MRKITAFYYLDFPDDNPPDPDCAETEMRVEVGGDHADIDNFDVTYSIRVYTTSRIKQLMDENHGEWATIGPALIVSRLDDTIVRRALESILFRIDELFARE